MDDTDRARVHQLLGRVRAASTNLLDGLDVADVEQQHVAFMGPLVWDLGHIANFEEWWLLRALDGRAGIDPDLDTLYDPFASPRAERGSLSLLDWDETAAYSAHVRAEALDLLARADARSPLTRDGRVYRMVAQHENQHQETMLQALNLRDDLRRPPPLALVTRASSTRGDEPEPVPVPAGPFPLGTDATSDTYDNERPAHVVEVDGFAIDRFPLTCRRYAQFMADGGYQRPELWSARGWRWLANTGHTRPQGWQPDRHGGFRVRRFGRVVPLHPAEPVTHISWFEAEAVARWAGGRLPTEAEWEKAAAWDPAARRKRRHPWGAGPVTATRANVGLRRGGPVPAGSRPAGASAYGVEQCVGDVYEWTSSAFAGYPGFRAHPYPEYSEVFFGGDYRVLRGASWANEPSLARATYRNWDHPYRRQLFAGVRLAWDVDDHLRPVMRDAGERDARG